MNPEQVAEMELFIKEYNENPPKLHLPKDKPDCPSLLGEIRIFKRYEPEKK